MNQKKTGSKMSSAAGKVLNDDSASAIQKKLAGSALSQTNPSHQTGVVMEDIASKVLQSSKYGDLTKSLAGSVLSQSNKGR